MARPNITGSHAVLYSADPEGDRGFFRKVLGFPFVDAGDGWLIFELPPGELGVHPAKEGESPPGVELFLTCEDLDSVLLSLKSRRARYKVEGDRSWGRLVTLFLPSGARLGLYQPMHPSPASRKRKGKKTV